MLYYQAQLTGQPLLLGHIAVDRRSAGTYTEIQAMTREKVLPALADTLRRVPAYGVRAFREALQSLRIILLPCVAREIIHMVRQNAHAEL